MTMLAPPPTAICAQPQTPRLVTPEELYAMPDNSTMELVDGRIVEKNVSYKSVRAEGLIHRRFENYLDVNPVAEAFVASFGYRCFADAPNKIRKPDVTVIRVERLRELENPDPGYMPLVPDLAVEVVSSNDGYYDVMKKVKEYLDAGFPLVWVVDLVWRTVMEYRSDVPPTLYNAGDEITAENALPGFRCKVADLLPPAA